LNEWETVAHALREHIKLRNNQHPKEDKKGKAHGPDNIPIKVWVALGDKSIQYLTV
jgi:hypothetical protein